MSNYTITSPSIESLISEDALYFEGIKRPLIAFALREDMQASKKFAEGRKATEFPTLDSHEHIAILERYFNDIYSLFLKKIAIFSGEDSVSGDSATKLQALLQEMIKVKGLIEAASSASVGRSLKE
ncbi:MAG: hypothetical protein JWO73_701 [Candidatus Taylorbacteria bacterium]|nr:hypothetical protein [Candidatus Taylorbacteria bacterium]